MPPPQVGRVDGAAGTARADQGGVTHSVAACALVAGVSGTGRGAAGAACTFFAARRFTGASSWWQPGSAQRASGPMAGFASLAVTFGPTRLTAFAFAARFGAANLLTASLALFAAAHRFFCAAAIRARPAALSLCLFLADAAAGVGAVAFSLWRRSAIPTSRSYMATIGTIRLGSSRSPFQSINHRHRKLT
jgi:hypothetical protein